jgi:hypothetical protein
LKVVEIGEIKRSDLKNGLVSLIRKRLLQYDWSLKKIKRFKIDVAVKIKRVICRNQKLEVYAKVSESEESKKCSFVFLVTIYREECWI